MGSHRKLVVLTAALIAMITPFAGSAAPPSGGLNPAQLLTGLEGGSGSTVGPGGALYVTETAAGRISRVDPKTGHITTFASGLPKSIVGLGGAMDVAFIGKTAYALVTLVGSDVGGSDVVGIYRVDGPDSFTVVADIGAFSLSNPPTLRSTSQPESRTRWKSTVAGSWSPMGTTIGCCGSRSAARSPTSSRSTTSSRPGWRFRVTRCTWPKPAPSPTSPRTARWCRSGRSRPPPWRWPPVPPLLVDVEFGRGRTLYALSQGLFGGGPAGSPAQPNTGSLVKVNGNGIFTVLADGFHRPTSLELIGNTAYVVILSGEIWKFDSGSGPPEGSSR
jgi:hypothetical protein